MATIAADGNLAPAQVSIAPEAGSYLSHQSIHSFLDAYAASPATVSTDARLARILAAAQSRCTMHSCAVNFAGIDNGTGDALAAPANPPHGLVAYSDLAAAIAAKPYAA
jgi:hypothetical protein